MAASDQSLKNFTIFLRAPYVWCILPLLRFSRKALISCLIKNLWLLEENGNTHALLSFVSSTNELKNYSNKPFKQNLFKDCKRVKNYEEREL